MLCCGMLCRVVLRCVMVCCVVITCIVYYRVMLVYVEYTTLCCGGMYMRVTWRGVTLRCVA